jgi:ABC-type transport system substrate-binding protein
MRRNRGGFAAAFAVSLALAAPIADAQKSGGVLIMSHFDSPASMSMHEEATGAVNRPMMGVFNNLVMYRQDVAQNSMASIVPDLATGWSWNEEGTELTLPLRPGVSLRPFPGRYNSPLNALLSSDRKSSFTRRWLAACLASSSRISETRSANSACNKSAEQEQAEHAIASC